ncbi:mask-1 [Symbiodinium sp. CCMP2592]|nr:mask-1 [Symbiodinium sp. CCMP2592]
MPLCGNGTARSTPLRRYAKSLARGSPSPPKPPMQFPMYTLPVERLLEMGEIEPHEVLKERGLLVDFEESMGKAAFVSHQWVGQKHPDPEFKQLRVLQDALKHILSKMRYICLDFFTELLVFGAKPLDTEEIRVQPLFIWYDYFSCPQLDLQIIGSLDGRLRNAQGSELVQAIYSIPAYISRCSFFFALCPVIDSANQSKVFTPFTWSDRGWCRFERACRELSENASWILIRSRTELELIASPFAAIGGSAGEGAFTLAEDKLQLAEVLLQALKRKLHLLLQREDLEGYRVLLNLQHVHLRGFSVRPWQNLVPGFEPTDLGVHDPSSLRASRFLHENGFSSLGDVDRRGWSPLHYAALAGDALVIECLLEQRADLHRLTQKDQPQAGVQPWASALAICVMFKHSKATRLLVAAKAQLNSGIQPPLHMAAMANNAEGIRILCGAGCKVNSKDVFGFSSFEAACGFGSLEAADELLQQAAYQIDVSRALFCAMANRGGKAELVHRLLALRADVDHQFKQSWLSLHGIYTCVRILQQKSGKATFASRAAYHGDGMTPLMAAVMSGQYEGAAALIAAGASLDLRNGRKWSTFDFAREQSLPHFLMEALEGRIEEVGRIFTDAVASSQFEI